MKDSMFNKAYHFITGDKASVDQESDNLSVIAVGDHEVSFFYKNHGKVKKLHFNCTCRHGSLFPGTLCSHVMAAIIYKCRTEVKNEL